MKLPRPLALLLLLALLLNATAARAGGGPENVAVIVNDENESSKTIADAYVKMRGIPACNVIRLKGLPKGHVISVGDFREKILKPVLASIKERGLDAQIDYIVYSDGFPYAVDIKPDMEGKTFHKVITQPASLTGLTYLADLVLSQDTAYLDLEANRYFRAPKIPRVGQGWTQDQQKQFVAAGMLLQRYQELVKPKAEEKKEAVKKDEGVAPAKEQLPADHPLNDPAKVLGEAVRLLELVDRQQPGVAEVKYNLACALALQGNKDGALSMLTEAVDAGWADRRHTEKDSDLTALRETPGFRALLTKMAGRTFDFAATEPFRHAYGWDENGRRLQDGQGRHYRLSVMLAWTGGKGTTQEEALKYLKDSVSADGTRPKGTIYLLANGDVRSTAREWAFPSTLKALKELGIQAEQIDGVLPKNKEDVQGLVVGAANFSWPESGSTIRPGAICEHLTSFGGALAGTGQQVLSEFLRYGAAGASGTVTEPYAVQNKFPNSYMHVHYARGASLAEAFYQSVAGPYQLLIVGDPLCQPWARVPKVSVIGLTGGDVVKAPVRVKAEAAVDGGVKVLAFEYFVDGVLRQSLPPAETFELDPAGMRAGEHELRVVAMTDGLETRGRSVVLFVLK